MRSRRVGGATYQVPVEVPQRRARTLAVRWLVEFARNRREKTMAERLAGELLDAQSEAGRRVQAQGRHLPHGAGQQGLRPLPLVVPPAGWAVSPLPRATARPWRLRPRRSGVSTSSLGARGASRAAAAGPRARQARARAASAAGSREASRHAGARARARKSRPSAHGLVVTAWSRRRSSATRARSRGAGRAPARTPPPPANTRAKCRPR